MDTPVIDHGRCTERCMAGFLDLCRAKKNLDTLANYFNIVYI